MNREAERKRLVELLTDDLDGADNPLMYAIDEIVERLADYILADGWMRPPCKVGDKVYIKNHEITINEIFLGEELLFSTYFDCDWVMENIGCEDCPFADWEQSYEGEWDCRTRGWFSFAEKDIGKTVFLTREDAEAKLKEGGEG